MVELANKLGISMSLSLLLYFPPTFATTTPYLAFSKPQPSSAERLETDEMNNKVTSKKYINRLGFVVGHLLR